MSEAEHEYQHITVSDGQMVLPIGNDETDLYNYEMVAGEFFAQTKEPAFTINVNKVYVNTAAVRLLSQVDFVKFMINRDEKKLVIKPCSELDIHGYRWVRTKDGKRYPSQRTGQPFVESLCMMMDWNPLFRYKIIGRKNREKGGNGDEILSFDLLAFKCFEREISEDGKVSAKSSLPAGWNGSFGPKYGEYDRTLEVRTFDRYTYFNLKGKESEVTDFETAAVSNADDTVQDTPDVTTE